ncbi:nucleotide sugar dehydrogenase [Membranihabitans marinus]|uniref:nucleotide sugar dehydrogenase n=1 Tax=Membranihabitans marinus TaxID=1227546 RepID=UPI0021D4732F|nr:nucleotide sugar dehydrogenase [Membranihabitans marinus]
MLKIGIIGLGYVGLPLAVEFAKKYPVVGFDIQSSRVAELNGFHDSTMEVEEEELREVLGSEAEESGLTLTCELNDIGDCNFYIITVPTPVDSNKKPNFGPLISASTTVGQVLKQGDIVVYESTVYPGATEEKCVPILSVESGLEFNKDFFVGYSPERINPGDKQHTLTKIVKITAGSTPEVAEKIDEVYRSIITAGTYRAASIRVAEAAKVIENCQRDINIAFVNELAKIFNKLNIDTIEVLEAAGSKWNFLPFRPGLVGGHCIGVDPYYLAQKAQEVGYHPEMILAGRRINDGMGSFVAQEIIKLMVKNDLSLKNSKILQLGITFKENCPDIRNTRAVDIYRELADYDLAIDVYDPWADPSQVSQELAIDLLEDLPDLNHYDCIVLCVSHRAFESIDPISLNGNTLIYDVKGFWDKKLSQARL